MAMNGEWILVNREQSDRRMPHNNALKLVWLRELVNGDLGRGNDELPTIIQTNRTKLSNLPPREQKKECANFLLVANWWATGRRGLTAIVEEAVDLSA